MYKKKGIYFKKIGLGELRLLRRLLLAMTVNFTRFGSTPNQN